MSQIPIFVNRLLKQEAKIRTNVLRTIFTTIFQSKKVSFELSDIGEGIREVVIKEWFVNIGDKVSQFDNICEVQSDKASVTITSRYDGIIKKLYYQVDDVAFVGKPLVDLETDEQTDENEINEQSVKPADALYTNAELIKENAEEEAVFTVSSSNSDKNSVLCIPSVRRLAKEHNIDLTKVTGTGKYGRILKEDVLRYLEESQFTVSQKGSGTVAFEQSDVKVEPITGFKKAMVKTMSEAMKIPHFVYSDEIRVTTLSKLRQELKKFPELDVKLTFLPFFIKAASNALRLYPVINSSVDENCENIIYRKHHNIGIAMDTDQGLAVPVIKQVENLSLLEVARELNRLIKNGKSGTFSPSDLSGGTFTISNIGIVISKGKVYTNTVRIFFSQKVILINNIHSGAKKRATYEFLKVGGTYTKPVILPPQVAIIAIGKTQVLPRFDDAGNIKKEEILNISGSADHRIIDGVSMANFIKTLKKQVENPNLLFLNL